MQIIPWKNGIYFYVHVYSKDKQQTKGDVIHMVKYWKILCITQVGTSAALSFACTKT